MASVAMSMPVLASNAAMAAVKLTFSPPTHWDWSETFLPVKSPLSAWSSSA
jgi:hypothetical protein